MTVYIEKLLEESAQKLASTAQLFSEAQQIVQQMHSLRARGSEIKVKLGKHIDQNIFLRKPTAVSRQFLHRKGIWGDRAHSDAKVGYNTHKRRRFAIFAEEA